MKILTLLSVLLALTIPSMADEKVLRHVVAFKFKPEATAEQIKAVESAFAALPASIPEVKAFEAGTNVSPEGLDKGFTHAFLLTFATDKDRDAYLVHPEHKKFGSVVKPVVADVIVIDYWTGGE